MGTVVRSDVAEAYLAIGNWRLVESLLRRNISSRRSANPADRLWLAADLSGLGLSLINQSRWSEAERVLRECLAIRAESIPDGWQRFAAMTHLGEAIMGQGRYDEAEKLVVTGYEGMKARESTIPKRLPFLAAAAARVVRLYEAWDKPDQARAWAKKLGLADLPADVFSRR